MYKKIIPGEEFRFNGDGDLKMLISPSDDLLGTYAIKIGIVGQGNRFTEITIPSSDIPLFEAAVRRAKESAIALAAAKRLENERKKT